MTLQTIWSTFTKIIDISLVWLMFYYILKNIKNNVKMVLIVKGIFLIIVIKVISNILNLYEKKVDAYLCSCVCAASYKYIFVLPGLFSIKI